MCVCACVCVRLPSISRARPCATHFQGEVLSNIWPAPEGRLPWVCLVFHIRWGDDCTVFFFSSSPRYNIRSFTYEIACEWELKSSHTHTHIPLFHHCFRYWWIVSVALTNGSQLGMNSCCTVFFFGWSWLVGFPGPHSAGMITGGWRRRILLVESLGLLGGSAFELNKPWRMTQREVGCEGAMAVPDPWHGRRWKVKLTWKIRGKRSGTPSKGLEHIF